MSFKVDGKVATTLWNSLAETSKELEQANRTIEKLSTNNSKLGTYLKIGAVAIFATGVIGYLWSGEKKTEERTVSQDEVRPVVNLQFNMAQTFIIEKKMPEPSEHQTILQDLDKLLKKDSQKSLAVELNEAEEKEDFSLLYPGFEGWLKETEELREQVTTAQEELKSVESKLIEMCLENSKLTETVSSYSQGTQKLTQLLKEAQQEKQRLEELLDTNIDQYSNALKEMSQKLRERKKEAESLQQELTETVNQLYEKEAKLNKANERTTLKEKKIVQLEDQVRVLEQEVSSQRDELILKVRENKTLRQELTLKGRQIEKQEQTLQKHDNFLEELIRENQKLKQTVSSLKEQTTEKTDNQETRY